MNWLPRPADGTAHVAPSLLSADFGQLAAEIDSVTEAGADLLHLDIMDGHFVPNITFGPFICEAVRRLTRLPLDAHLMISRADLYVDAFAESGVDAITVHVESDIPITPTLDRIRELGLKCGISLNPGTPLERIVPYLPGLDLILVMTVQPGFGGQKFDPAGVLKIAELQDRRDREGLDYLISVDGGINHETGRNCRDAGADILVSGSWLMGAEDRGVRTQQLRGM